MSQSKLKIASLFKSQYAALLNYVQGQISSLEDAEDLIQDVYFKAMKNLNALESIDNLTGWLFTVIKNEIIDWYRRKKPTQLSLDDENKEIWEKLLAEMPVDVADREEQDILLEAIYRAIENLPQEQKFVFVENVVQGRTFRQLAELTGESINTLLARKRYAVINLRKQLKNLRENLE
ncbi:MAG: sigma-70 family RNA polymerase sigma factor [Calditrichaeota bacterium]|nr:sigma-70 family RNA polymerase sigma factor [Calditrichota bacterium]